MLVCIDICLRELFNLPESQKLLKKVYVSLLRSFTLSEKWKVAGEQYRLNDMEEILQAEGGGEV